MSRSPLHVEAGAGDLGGVERPPVLGIGDRDRVRPRVAVLDPLQRAHESLLTVALVVEPHRDLAPEVTLEMDPLREGPFDAGARYLEHVPLGHRPRRLQHLLEAAREPGAVIESDATLG